jgi:hypothetical protein
MDGCVYTALLGDYEPLVEQPTAAKSQIPFICFTDDPHLKSESWEIRLVHPCFPGDPVRSQRELKIRPHIHLPEFAQSLYIDNSVLLSEPPEGLFDLAGGLPERFLICRHSYRETVLDEFLEVARLGLDDSNRIFEQLNHYLLHDPEVLNGRPLWGAMMIRDHRNRKLCSALDIWALHVMRYSRRDQLSLNMALHLAGIRPEPIRWDNYKSQYHTWPHAMGRKLQAGDRNPSVSLMPLVARLRLYEQQLIDSRAELDMVRNKVAQLSRQFEDARAEADDARAEAGASQEQAARLQREIKELTGRLAAGEALLTHRGAEVAHLTACAAELHSTVASLRESTSWRVTAPLRAAKKLFNRHDR